MGPDFPTTSHEADFFSLWLSSSTQANPPEPLQAQRAGGLTQKIQTVACSQLVRRSLREMCASDIKEGKKALGEKALRMFNLSDSDDEVPPNASSISSTTSTTAKRLFDISPTLPLFFENIENDSFDSHNLPPSSSPKRPRISRSLLFDSPERPKTSRSLTFAFPSSSSRPATFESPPHTKVKRKRPREQPFPATPALKRKKPPAVLAGGKLPQVRDIGGYLASVFLGIENNPFLVHPDFAQRPSSYIDLDGEKLSVLKQLSSKGCGAGAVMMLFSDVLRKGSDSARSSINQGHLDNMWSAICGCYLASGKSLLEIANKFPFEAFQYQLCLKRYTYCEGDTSSHAELVSDSSQILGKVAARIQNSKNSVILSITHPQIGGHWIVVDQLDEADVVWRDPYAGTAHRVPRKPFGEWLGEGDGRVKALYLGRTNSSSSHASSSSSTASFLKPNSQGFD